MKYTLICLVILLLASVPVGARTVELTIHPAKTPEPAQKYQLLPKANELTDADAAPIYEKALKSLPNDIQMNEINQWLNTPPEKLPREQVQSTLKRLKPALELLEQAAKCKQCNWPYLDDDTLSQNLRVYRKFVSLLALEMRFQIAQGRYDKAIRTTQTGFAMARNLGKAPDLLRGLVAVSISAYICRQLEQFIQQSDVPNLYGALRDLPKPFIGLTKQAQWEDPDIKEKVHILMNRLDRHIAALQCIEALRLYADNHNGKFPNELSDITEVPVPNDPVTRKPFAYSRTGIKAILEGPAPKAAPAKEAIRYELNLKE